MTVVMAYDYDKLYGETPDALGEPTPILVDFFNKIDKPNARILDVGCGQGRDALFLARLGHTVVGVDLSQNGIDDMLKVARANNLEVEGIMTDLIKFKPKGMFDYILIDRTLHMLSENDRLAVLDRMLKHVVQNGWVLIADEASNMAGFKSVFQRDKFEWTYEFLERGYLFARRG